MEGFKQVPTMPTPESSRIFFEASAKKGRAYVSCIEKLIRKDSHLETDELAETDLDDFMKAGSEFFKIQSERYRQGGGTPEILFKQLFQDGVLPPEFTDQSKYELSEPTEGVFILKTDIHLLEKVRSGATAVAVKIKDGISFVLVPVTGEASVDENLGRENILHEVHHLFWKGAMDNNLLARGENDHDLQASFSMYQDELVARMSSGGALFGYSHLSMLNPETQEAFKKENPEKFKQIIDTVSGLNDFCRELSEEMTIRNIEGEGLIGLIIDAKSFSDLKASMQKFKDFVITQPITNPRKQSVTGWDFI